MRACRIHAIHGGIPFAFWVAFMVTLRHEIANTYRLDIGGALSREDFARAEEELAIVLDRIGSARLLCVLTAFHGWETQGDWSNLGFYMKDGDAIERIAIVGEERWRDLAMMFANAGLRKAPVEFFPANDMAHARDWLAS